MSVRTRPRPRPAAPAAAVPRGAAVAAEGPGAPAAAAPGRVEAGREAMIVGRLRTVSVEGRPGRAAAAKGRQRITPTQTSTRSMRTHTRPFRSLKRRLEAAWLVMAAGGSQGRDGLITSDCQPVKCQKVQRVCHLWQEKALRDHGGSGEYSTKGDKEEDIRTLPCPTQPWLCSVPGCACLPQSAGRWKREGWLCLSPRLWDETHPTSWHANLERECVRMDKRSKPLPTAYLCRPKETPKKPPEQEIDDMLAQLKKKYKKI